MLIAAILKIKNLSCESLKTYYLLYLIQIEEEKDLLPFYLNDEAYVSRLFSSAIMGRNYGDGEFGQSLRNQIISQGGGYLMQLDTFRTRLSEGILANRSNI
jgi:hypothetical protein